MGERRMLLVLCLAMCFVVENNAFLLPLGTHNLRNKLACKGLCPGRFSKQNILHGLRSSTDTKSKASLGSVVDESIPTDKDTPSTWKQALEKEVEVRITCVFDAIDPACGYPSISGCQAQLKCKR
jgi:hypothetical protein